MADDIAPRDAAEHELPVRFTGSGSEYFRIWIVNLLLTLVTLGLYYPWAKVRRLRYFHGNTMVGDHALDFHGNPKRMLRGFLLVALFGALYVGATRFSPAAGSVAVLSLGLLWPALWRASLQFRLANTSWRGLRMRFDGSMPGAYQAVLPVVLPGLLIFAFSAFMAPDAADAADARAQPPMAASLGVLVVMLAASVMTPWLVHRLKRYQHGHYGLAALRTQLQAGAASFYRVFGAAFGVTLALMLVTGVLGAVAAYADRASAAAAEGAAGPGLFAGMAPLAVGMAGYLALFLIVGPFVTSRLQNLVWGRTAGNGLRFVSALKGRTLVGLTLKNLLLMIVTLGLYWPFARVAVARLRLEAITVFTAADPDTLYTRDAARMADAAGDAAGDLFGIDIGL